MPFRTRWLQFKANRKLWEDRVFIAAVVLFAAAAAANAGPMFWNGGITIPGAVCSWLYLAVWFSAAVFLRNRAGWVRTALIARWSAVAAVLLALAVTASGSANMLASVCVLPYAVFIAVYGGLGRAGWVYYALLALQAMIAAGLFVRLRKKRRKAGEA